MVFDLGGGTFDVSVIGIGMHQYETLATESIMQLGGDDFDQLLFNLAIQKAHLKVELTQAQKSDSYKSVEKRRNHCIPIPAKYRLILSRPYPERVMSMLRLLIFIRSVNPW